jgi:alginate O-acetyltransferase complex protein AlgI
VIWGLYHGFFLVLERVRLGRLLDRSAALSHAYTLTVIVCGWVIFRSPDLPTAASYLAAMAGFGQAAVESVSSYMPKDIRMALIAGIVFSAPVYQRLAEIVERHTGPAASRAAAAGVLLGLFRTASLAAVLLVCLMLLSAGTHNPFIYFRF